MEFESWHLWIIGMIIFILLEMVVPSFVMASIAMGCFFAFIGAAIHLPLTLQIILFIIGTLTGFIGVKPVMIKYAYRRKSVKTNASGLVGRIGKVIEPINEMEETGCVAIDGDQWKAISINEDIIPEHTKVKVTKVDSIVLTVEEIPQGKHEEHDTQIENGSGRLRIRVGTKTYFISFNEIKGVYSSNKITYIVSSPEKKYIHDKSLEQLGMELPAELFFRANRQLILNKETIQEVKAGKNGKIDVALQQGVGLPKRISVSRLKAHAFREWMR